MKMKSLYFKTNPLFLEFEFFMLIKLANNQFGIRNSVSTLTFQ